MSMIPNFLYLITLFLPGVSFSTESVAGSNVSEEDEETSSSISGTTVSSELPLSVVHEILLRLPHKSFIRCKCVCKSWLNLISDPYFTRAYFANPPFTTVVLSHCRLVINMPRQDTSFCFIEIESNGDVTRAPFNPRALDFRVNGTDLDLKGSCNGLLCITQTHLHNVAVYVINPLLGEFLMLPPVEQQTKSMWVRALYGFGCRRYSNRYKVLRVVQDLNTAKVHSEILTVGFDEKWRSFEDASLTMELNRDGFAMNGVVHFLGDYNGYCFMITFDVEEESVRHINLPPVLLDHPWSNFHLAVWDDKLCFNVKYIDHVDIWTMKEYGVVESWSKETILKSRVPIELRPYPLHPITTLRNKALLMSCDIEDDTQLLRLASYNPMVKMCTKHEFPAAAAATKDVESYWFAYVPNAIPLMDNLLGGDSQ